MREFSDYFKRNGKGVKIFPDSPKRNQIKTKNRNQKIFYALMMAIPILQFIVFYVVVNANSIVLSFKDYNVDTGAYDFVGFETIKSAVSDFFGKDYLVKTVWNSLLLTLVSLVAGIGGAVIFSFYIYKKYIFSGVFKVALFLPSIISSMVMATLFWYVAEGGLPALREMITGQWTSEGLLTDPKTDFGTALFFTVWIGFGPLIMMFSAAMNDISPSIVESAELDGITPIKEFWFITLPLIWETFVTYVVATIAATFVNQMNLFSFYSANAEPRISTVGYYLFSSVSKPFSSYKDYPELSALGVVFTLITIPVAFAVRYLMRKFGPSEN